MLSSQCRVIDEYERPIVSPDNQFVREQVVDGRGRLPEAMRRQMLSLFRDCDEAAIEFLDRNES